MKGNKVETLPSTQGGIVELTGSQSEAADWVLRAPRFLNRNGTMYGAAQAFCAISPATQRCFCGFCKKRGALA